LVVILKNQVEWALHCCAILAGLPEGHYLSTKALAELHGVPKEYLSKALQALSQAELVLGTLGPTGGYRLARATDKITFLDIVEAVEGKSSSFACTEIRRNNPCRPARMVDKTPCAVARVMWGADKAWRDHLRGAKLSDLVKAVEKDVPPDILGKTFDWVLDRT
jgi:Rrf2 family protein